MVHVQLIQFLELCIRRNAAFQYTCQESHKKVLVLKIRSISEKFKTGSKKTVLQNKKRKCADIRLCTANYQLFPRLNIAQSQKIASQQRFYFEIELDYLPYH